MNDRMTTSSRKRQRRTAEEARRVILDSAEKRLAMVGPAGIRLQEVAADIGISHPAILHHFGSREGLVDAVIKRAVGRLRKEFLEALTEQLDSVKLSELLDSVSEVLGRRGHAKLLAWLVMSTEAGQEQILTAEDYTLGKISDAVAALRVQASECEPASVREDSSFVVLLVALAMFGDSIGGALMRRSAGVSEDDDVSKRFRQWLADLLLAHIAQHDGSEHDLAGAS
jgi:AcrR family transcriptional regulator